MTNRIAGLVAALVLALPLHADFASIARAIDAKEGVSRNWIPFLGLARVVVRAVEPNGVNDFQLVTFQGADRLDARELHALMQQQIGAGFRPLVQAHSKRSGEWSFIYAKPARGGNHVELVILAHDDEDTVLVRVNVDAEVLARQLAQPEQVSRVGR